MVYIALIIPSTLTIANWQEKTLSAFRIIISTATYFVFIIKFFIFNFFLVYIANDLSSV